MGMRGPASAYGKKPFGRAAENGRETVIFTYTASVGHSAFRCGTRRGPRRMTP